MKIFNIPVVYSNDYAAGRVQGLRTTGYKSVYEFQNLNNKHGGLLKKQVFAHTRDNQHWEIAMYTKQTWDVHIVKGTFFSIE